MARPERNLDPAAGPVAALAAELRELRRRAGTPGYRELAKRTGYSVSTLAEAVGGRRLPSLAVVHAFVRACGADAAEWERRWRRAGRELAAGRRDAAAGVEEAPYRGLTRYGVSDAELFFGRQRVVKQLLEMLSRQRFVAVFGVSGSGKSSLLRAGLVPAVSGSSSLDGTGDGLRPANRAGGFHPVLLTPGSEPVTALANALDPVPTGRDVLLVVDQFEELFTLCPDPAERAGFVAELAALAERPDGAARTRVVIGVRADFYARCSELPVLAGLIAGANVPVGPLSEDELREVITGPAHAAGLTVERALVTKVLADAGGRPGGLPLVSHALLETWRQRRGNVLAAADYETTGGVAGAVAQTAEAFYAGLTPGQQDTARQVLVRLVTLGEGVEDTRRRAARSELDFPDVDTVLERMAAERLVVLGNETAEIAHEALITAWPRLHGWLHADRDQLRLHRQLTDAATQWQALDRDADALYRGARLAAWTDQALEPLNELERAFLAASRDREAHEQRIRTRRIRLTLVALISGVVVLSVLAGLAVAQAHRATDQRDLALSRQLVADARAQLQVDQQLALRLATQAYDTKPTAEAEAVLRQAVLDHRLRAEVPAGQGQVWGVAFRPDGKQVATSGADGTVRLWDIIGPDRPRAQPRVLRGHTGPARSPVFSPDGRQLATSGEDGTVRLWDLAAGGTVGVLRGHQDPVRNLAFSPDGRRLVSAGDDGTVRVWDRAGRHAPLVLRPGGPVMGVAFSRDGRFLAAAGDAIWVWPAMGTGRPRVLRGHDGPVENIAFSPDGQRLASSGAYDHTVRVWSTTSGRAQAVLRGNDRGVETVAFSPDGQRVAAGYSRGAVRIWNAPTPTKDPLALEGHDDPLVLRGHDGAVWSVAFSPDGKRLATASGDGTLRLWDPAYPGHPTLVGRHQGPAWTISSRGNRIASGSEDGTVRLWPHPAPGQPLILRGHTGEVITVAASPDRRRIASGGRDTTVRIWDTRTGAATVLRGHTRGVMSAEFSPDGRRLATASSDGTVRIWDTTGRGQPVVLRGHDGPVRSVAYSPTEHQVASGGSDGTVRIWDTTGHRPPIVLPAHPEGIVWSLDYSPDGTHLASGGHDSTIKVWNSDGHGQPRVLRSHYGIVWSVAYSPDGKQLASAGEDDGVRIWDTTTGNQLVDIRGHNTSVDQVQYRPGDGGHLITGHGDGTIRDWQCEVCGPAKEVRALADTRTIRQPSPEELNLFLHQPPPDGR